MFFYIILLPVCYYHYYVPRCAQYSGLHCKCDPSSVTSFRTPQCEPPQHTQPCAHTSEDIHTGKKLVPSHLFLDFGPWGLFLNAFSVILVTFKRLSPISHHDPQSWPSPISHHDPRLSVTMTLAYHTPCFLCAYSCQQKRHLYGTLLGGYISRTR